MVKMTGKAQSADVAALLRSRHSVLWIVTREEARVEGFLMEAAAAARYECRTWDCGQGVFDMTGREVRGNPGTDPGAALEYIANQARTGQSRAVWIMRDLAPWLRDAIGMTTVRQVRNLARLLPTVPLTSSQAVVVLTSSADVPPELAGHATVIEWSLPDREEIASILDAAVAVMPEAMRPSVVSNGTRDAAIDAAVGLSAEEAQNCFARSLVQNQRIDPAVVASEKKRVIARERVLEWHDPLPGGLSAVGGLEALKDWLESRRSAYSPAARAYGLPAPKGALLVGVPGCGKSLVAKAIATSWGVPLLKLDLGALKSKFVGESEGNLRKALQVIEAIGRCVVWLDEVEKALAGGAGESSDGGVSADALGAILGWMQDRSGEAFIVACGNDVAKLPSEFTRKGRFDDVWLVDLPTHKERQQIIRAAMKVHGRDWPDDVWNFDVASATDGFSGAEIASLVPDAMYTAFADGEREITVQDLLNATVSVVPTSKSSAEKITALRAWATGRARHATTPETASPATAGRMLDI